MKKLKAILTNPFLLGAQGFVIGAAFIWASPAPAEAAVYNAPVSAVVEAQAS